MAEDKKSKEEAFSYDENDDVFGDKGGEFLRQPKAGQSIQIRFLREFDQWGKGYKHDVLKVDEKGKIVKTFGKKKESERWVSGFVCLNTKENLRKGIVCPICEEGLKPKPKFGAPVLDRATGTVKYFESHLATVYNQFRTHFKDNGTVMDVDFKISRTGSGLNDTVYSVSPITKSMQPVTDEEKKKGDKVNLEKFFAVKTREEIENALKGKTEEESSEDAVPF